MRTMFARVGLVVAVVGSVLTLDPGLAHAVPTITFDGSPGTAAPPATLGPYAMTAFPPDGRAIFADVTTVPSPAGGDVTFGAAVNHRRIGAGWATWSHGYRGDVYLTNGATSLVMTLPAGTLAFFFYAEPDPFAVITMTATAQHGTTSGPVGVNGSSGARYFGFYGTGGATIATITMTSGADFAVGEFGIARDPLLVCASATPPAGAIVGTAGNDSITGTPGNDVIFGLAGNDFIDGGGGNDLICGGDGNDLLLGGDGNDILVGGAGNDRLDGQGDNDTLFGQAGYDRLDGGAGMNSADGGTESDYCINASTTNCP